MRGVSRSNCCSIQAAADASDFEVCNRGELRVARRWSHHPYAVPERISVCLIQCLYICSVSCPLLLSFLELYYSAAEISLVQKLFYFEVFFHVLQSSEINLSPAEYQIISSHTVAANVSTTRHETYLAQSNQCPQLRLSPAATWHNLK
jgi:hypothetical protein